MRFTLRPHPGKLITALALAGGLALGAAVVPAGLASAATNDTEPAYQQAAGPVLYDSGAGQMQVYTAGTNGQLVEDYFDGNSWQSSTVTSGQSVTGTPSAIYDAASGEVQVYYNNEGHLWEAYYDGQGWQLIPLGLAMTGSPSAVWYPAGGQMQVYVNSNGYLAVTYPGAAKGSSSPSQVGQQAITGSPTAIYDTPANQMQVYYATGPATGGSLVESYWSYQTGGGWAQNTIGGSFTGTPGVMVDQSKGQIEVYVTGSDGDLWEATSPFSGTLPAGQELQPWQNVTGSTGDTVTGSPSPVYNQGGDQIEVYATGTGGQLEEASWDGSSWTWSTVTIAQSKGQPVTSAQPITGSPYAIFDESASQLQVYAAGTGSSQQEWYWSYPDGSGWAYATILTGSKTPL
jgi:hypothetical protein